MISKVKKVRLSVPLADKEKVLLKLQQSKSLMLSSQSDDNELDLTYENTLLSRADIAIKKLSGYLRTNRRLFAAPSVDFNNFTAGIESRIVALEDVEKLFDDQNFLQSENAEEQKLIDEVSVFASLPYTTKDLHETLFTTFFFGRIPDIKWELFLAYSMKNNILYDEYLPNDLGHNVVVIVSNESAATELDNLQRIGFEQITLPLLDVSIASYISTKQATIAANEKKLKEIDEILATSGKNDLEIKVLADQMLSQMARKRVISVVKNDEVIFNGFLHGEKEHDVIETLNQVSPNSSIESEEVTEFDKVPTLLKNHKFVQPFESVVNTYSVPNHTEIDPSPVMAFWYWIFFGLMIGDIGYGIVILLAMGLFNKFKKPSGEFGALTKIFFYSGITSMLAGIIYGSFFGASFDLFKLIGSLFNKNWTSVLVNPFNDPIKMLIFSLGVGIVHLCSGLVMKIILSFKRKNYFEALSHGFSWIFILVGLSLFAADIGLGNLPVLKYMGIGLMVLGLVFILVFTGIKSKSIVGKIFGGFGGLFKATSYLSDILSYSRILALSLSSAIIGSVMNMLAGLIQGNIVGLLLSPLVYIFGHLFTLVMGMLSAYVHGGRLEYLEFFGKFYEGGGYLFVPLHFETKYVDVI